MNKYPYGNLLDSVGKNKLINGNFDVWQRGTSLASGTGKRFLSDRFFNEGNGTTHTTSQQSFTPGQTEVPNEPSYFHRTVVTSVAGAGNFMMLRQCIESVRTLAGKKATLSFYAKADAAKNITLEFNQNFGTGGSPSNPINVIGVTTFNLTTSWKKYTVTVDIPSIAGKTIGTSGDDYLRLTLWYDAGSSYTAGSNTLGQQSGTFDIAQVQLEEGKFSTDFEARHISTELALCYRYFEKLSVALTGYACNATSWDNYLYWNYKTTKRATPTIYYAPGVAGTGVGTNVDSSCLSGLQVRLVFSIGSTADAEF